MNKNKKSKIIHILFLIAIAMIFIGFCADLVLVKKANEDVKTIEYSEKSSFQYNITLFDGTTYTEQDAFSFAPDMVKNIKVTFKYKNDYEGYLNNTLDANLVIHAKEGIMNNFSTTNYAVIAVEKFEPRKITATETEMIVDIDYQKYTSQLKNYIVNNSLNEMSYGKLELIISSVNKETKKDDKSILVITLLEDSAAIYTARQIDNTTSTVLGNNAKKFKLLAIGLFGLFVCSCFAFFFYHKLSKMDKYSRKMYFIFLLNKGVLVNGDLSKLDVENFMELSSFNELLKVQANLSLPIMYRKSESSCTFVIKTSNSGYYYTMNKE